MDTAIFFSPPILYPTSCSSAFSPLGWRWPAFERSTSLKCPRCQSDKFHPGAQQILHLFCLLCRRLGVFNSSLFLPSLACSHNQNWCIWKLINTSSSFSSSFCSSSSSFAFSFFLFPLLVLLFLSSFSTPLSPSSSCSSSFLWNEGRGIEVVISTVYLDL